MSKLQRVIKCHSILGQSRIIHIISPFGLLKFGNPDLHQPLELIPSVSERSDSIDIKRVLSHAYGITLKFQLFDVHLLVNSLTILLDSDPELVFKRLGVLLTII